MGLLFDLFLTFAKVGLESEISVAKAVNSDSHEVPAILDTINRRKEEIDAEWTNHFEQ